MAEFKPMVKMMTTEPSVILKLKKGGKVASKGMKDDGHKPMAGANPFSEAESGKAPKKPSMAERRRAMNPNLYAKGGEVAHKQMGGMMPASPGMVPGAAAPAPVPMQAMGRAALGAMPSPQRMKRAAMVRKALSGMKDGGSAECKALEKELKHHESMSMKDAHPVKKASGGIIMSKTGKTKVETAKKGITNGTTGEVKEGKPGGYKSGGGVKMGNAGGFKEGGKVPGLGNAVKGGDWENRPANSAKPGVKNTTTGEVKQGNGGGYKKGGSTKKAFATGGQVVDDGKAEKMPSKPISRPVANSMQSGTFKKGGKVKYFEDGGHANDKYTVKDPKAVTDKASRELEEALNPLSMIRELAGKARNYFMPKSADSVTKTKESVTVSPASKKRGGSAKC